MPLSLPEFVERWKASTLSERAAAQSHFIDLCEVLGHPHPAAADHTGESFAFEKHVCTLDEGKGYADVWKRGFLGWEYKGKHKTLNAAYAQLVRYQEDLENPPLLVTCDQERFEIHTNFTGTRPQLYSFTLDDLLPSMVLAGVPGKPSTQTGFGALTSTTSPPTGLLGVGLGGDSSPRMIAFQARLQVSRRAP